jgi:hypothetical protein
MRKRNATRHRRLLFVYLRRYLLYGLLRRPSTQESTPFIEISDLANPIRHPIGNWLAEVQELFGYRDLSEFAEKHHRNDEEEKQISYGRIRKWSCGLDLIPFAEIEKITDERAGLADVKFRHLVARTFALATDFVRSTAKGKDYPSRKVAQEVVWKRQIQLEQKVSTSLAPPEMLAKVGLSRGLDHGTRNLG